MPTPIITRISEAISSIKPYDTMEMTHIDNALQWMSATDNIFRVKKPDVPKKHLVSYFVLLDPNRKCILLCDHILAQLWLPSGGHVKPDEWPADTVRRESEEELNLPARFFNNKDKPFFITITDTVGLTPGHTDVSLWYLIIGNSLDYVRFDRREFNDVEWWSLQEILESDPTIFDPHMHRFAHKLMKHLEAF